MRLRTLAATAVTAALIPALAACGSNEPTAGPTASTTPSVTATIAATATGTATADTSAKHVAALKGLEDLHDLADKIAETKDVAAAKTLSEGLEPIWGPIEDHIRDLDPNAYVDIEDAMSSLETGDPAKTVPAAATLHEVVEAFAQAHP